MAFDIKKWLMEDMKFSEAEATEMVPRFTAERVGVIERNIGLSSELVAGRTAIETTQNELRAANERLNTEMAEWATLSTAEKAQSTELQSTIEKLRVRSTQLETRLTNLASQHGVDPQTLLKDLDVAPRAEPKAEPKADPNMVHVDMFRNTMNYQLELPATLQFISNQHRALTGEELDTREIVKLIKENAGKKDGVIDPVQLWETKYDIQAKRAAKAAQDQTQRETAAEARGYERARSEQSLPNTPPTGRHSPVFVRRDNNGVIQQRESALKRPQPGGTAAIAAAALRSGKYRTQPTAAAR